MPINGINDPQTLARTQPRVDFRIYKGGKKITKRNKEGLEYKIFGRDLNKLFRLETKDEYIKKILAQNYPINNRADAFLLEWITILPAYQEIDRTFDCSMELHNASGLLHKCDRSSIYLQMQEYEDPFGHKRKRAIDCDKPCPVAGTLEDCPHKCSKTGNLYFYVPELLEAGLNRLGCLSVHSYSDLIGITQKLQAYEQQFGSIKKPPFASPQTFNLIPYKLSRTEIKIKRPVLDDDGKRTGKKADGSTTWAVQLEILPSWLAQWQNYQRLNEIKQLGFAPSPLLIEQVYDVPVRHILPRNDLALKPVSEEEKINPDQAIELKELLKSSSWTPQQFLEVMAELGRDRVSDLSQNEFEQLKKIIH